MKFFKRFDFFGENFSFNYNGYNKYSTRLGGVIFLVFILIALFYFVDSAFPFFQRENYSLHFYSINNSKEKIELKQTFAFGIECENKETEKKFQSDLFSVKISYVINGDESSVSSKNCSSDSFGKELEDNLKNLNKSNNLPINDFKCIIYKNNNKIQGIYTDKNFSYYKIKLYSEKKNITDINKLLLKEELKCALQFYYKDYSIDIENYLNPIKPILNSIFLQINPNFNTKKNIYFMKYHFTTENKYIDFSNILYLKNNNEEELIGFSRTEDYFIYNSYDNLDDDDTITFATIYLRADNRKTVINRKYQNLLEFYAENISFWFGMFEILNIIFTIYNGFHASLSMSKKLFFFDEIKKDNKYSILKQNSIKNNSTTGKNNTNSNNDSINEIPEIINIDNKKNDSKKDPVVIYKNNYINKIDSEENLNINKKLKRDENEKKSKNYVSAYEVIKISILSCCCCKCKCCKKNIKYKEKSIKKAMDIFDKKLDIYIYTKNMILIDIMYRITMNDINKNYINFLTRSLIYLNKSDKKESEELKQIYEPTTKLNSDYSNKLFNEFKKLMEKEEKTEMEKKIIRLCKY